MSADYGYGVDTDGSGNFYMVGLTTVDLDGAGPGQIGTADLVITKYTGTGLYQWTRHLGLALSFSQVMYRPAVRLMQV